MTEKDVGQQLLDWVLNKHEVEKRPGTDWSVLYRNPDGTADTAVIFGLDDISTLGTEILSAIPDDATLLSLWRRATSDDSTKARERATRDDSTKP